MATRDEQIRQFLKEHRWLLLGCLVICVMLILAFAVLFVNVRALLTNARHLSESQLDNALEETESLFYNYDRLCTILSANGDVADFADLPADTSSEALSLAGYSLQKELTSLVSIYGEFLNNLALYFPDNQSIITMSRHLHGDELPLFWNNCPDLTPELLNALPKGTFWNAHLFPESRQNWIVQRARTQGDRTVFILIEYDFNYFTERLTGGSNDLLLLTGDPESCLFSSGAVPSDDVWQQIVSRPSVMTQADIGGESNFVLSSSASVPDVRIAVMIPSGYTTRIEFLFYFVVAITGIVVLVCLGSMLLYLNKRIFVPLRRLSRIGNYAEGDLNATIQAVADDFLRLENNQDKLLKERRLLVPLALGRSLTHLSEIPARDADSAHAKAASCLQMAGLTQDGGYALFAVVCSDDTNGFFRFSPDALSDSPKPDLFFFLLENILNDILFQTHPGVLAILPDGWYAVITACAGEEEAQDISSAAQRLSQVYSDLFKAGLQVTELSWGAGADQFFRDTNKLFRQTSFLQFWGEKQSAGTVTSEQLDFTNYCRLVRKLINRLGARDYENVPAILDDILAHAMPGNAEDIQLSKNRIYAMTSVLAITIDEQLSDEQKFVDSLHLEERLYGTDSIASFRKELRDILSALIEHREAASDAPDNLMEDIRQYLLEHYTETGLNVTSVAEHFGISISYLSRSFKEIYGVNLLEYLQRLRVDAAKKLLLNNSIKAVAPQVGFWDTQGLVRAFKKYEGVGPGEYKKMLKLKKDAQG